MSGQTVANLSAEPALGKSGMIYKIQRGDEPSGRSQEGLWLRQGFGQAQYKGSLTFVFTLTEQAQVKGYLSISEALDGVKKEKIFGTDTMRFSVRTFSDEELEKIIEYFQDVCPKVSQELFPEWHAARN